MGTVWHAHIEIEKNGESAGYNDTVTTHNHIPTTEEVKNEVIGTIIAHSPHLNGGWITRCNIRRIR